MRRANAAATMSSPEARRATLAGAAAETDRSNTATCAATTTARSAGSHGTHFASRIAPRAPSRGHVSGPTRSRSVTSPASLSTKTRASAKPVTARYASLAGLKQTRATSKSTGLRDSGLTPTRASPPGSEEEDPESFPPTAPGPPTPAMAPASRTHTLSPSATASRPAPSEQLSADRFPTVPDSIARRSSGLPCAASCSRREGRVSNEPALKLRRRCARRADAPRAFESAATDARPDSGNARRGGIEGGVTSPTPSVVLESRRRSRSRSHVATRREAKPAPRNASRSASPFRLEKHCATPATSAPESSASESSSASTSSSESSTSRYASSSSRSLSLSAWTGVGPAETRERVESSSARRLAAADAASSATAAARDSASMSAATAAAAALRGVRHWHETPCALPAPQSQKKRDSREYTTLCPRWHALAHAEQHPREVVRSHV